MPCRLLCAHREPGMQAISPACKPAAWCANCEPSMRTISLVCKPQVQHGSHQPGMQATNLACESQIWYASHKPSVPATSLTCKPRAQHENHKPSVQALSQVQRPQAQHTSHESGILATKPACEPCCCQHGEGLGNCSRTGAARGSSSPHTLHGVFAGSGSPSPPPGVQGAPLPTLGQDPAADLSCETAQMQEPSGGRSAPPSTAPQPRQPAPSSRDG